MKSSEIRFGDYVFDSETKRLSKAGAGEVELRHQSREVLALLAARPSATIAKREFIDAVWHGARVSDESLAKCIAEIRRAIGDDDKRRVETIPRKGYRLVPDLPATRARRPGLFAAAAALLALGLGAWVFWMLAPPTPRAEQPVVAVLPFEDLSPGPQRGYLSDAISEGVIVDLARFPELAVIAASSSFRFRDPARDIAKVAETLGADFILDGSQQFDGTTLRVTARLIDADTRASIWTDSTDAPIGGLFEVNEAIGNRVANAVLEKVVDVRSSAQADDDPAAMLMYFRARELTLGRLSRENQAEAIALAREIIETHPDQPWGYIALALNLRTQVRFGWNEAPAEAVLNQAESLAQRAVEQAPDNYGGHFALGRVLMQQGDQARAIRHFETSIALNPAASHTYNALAQPLLYLGRTEEALDILDRAEKIDPLGSFVHHWMKAWTLWQARRCDEARTSLGSIATLPPEAHKLLAVIHICLGEEGAAKAALVPFLTANPGWTLSQEAALHAGVWTHADSLHLWLDALRQAGLAEG